MIAFSTPTDSSPAATPETYLPVKTAAEYTGYNSQYLRRLLQNGSLEGIKVGQMWLVKVASLDEYLKSIRGAADRRYGPRVYQEYIETKVT